MSTLGSRDGLTESQLEAMEEKTYSTILLSLNEHIIREVAIPETILWVKSELLYITKSLTNKLLLKQQFFSLRMQ